MIREEQAEDLEGIRAVNRAAFGGDDEVRLIDSLRSAGLVVCSLVALRDGEVCGHVLFSKLPVKTAAGEIAAVSLAPMAVHPRVQRMGYGSTLVRAGLELARVKGYDVALVLGHPGYYPRFGFSVELGRQVKSPYSGDAWMAMELKAGALSGVHGSVEYPPAWAALQG